MARGMVVFDATGNVLKKVGGNEEGVKDAGGAVDTDQSELVGQAYREGDVVLEGKAEKEDERG